MPESCIKCGKGREICMYCCDDDTWDLLCDCGLVDFGEHLISCTIVVRASYDGRKR